MSDSLYLWSGTGALVGDNVVLTASHVVPWFALALGFKWSMKLIPACYDGELRFGKGVYSYVAKVWGYSDHSQGDDMAVLKLKVPLGKSLGFFGCKTYSDDWEGGAYWNLWAIPTLLEEEIDQLGKVVSAYSMMIPMGLVSNSSTPGILLPGILADRCGRGGVTVLTSSGHTRERSTIGTRTTASRPEAPRWRSSCKWARTNW